MHLSHCITSTWSLFIVNRFSIDPILFSLVFISITSITDQWSSIKWASPACKSTMTTLREGEQVDIVAPIHLWRQTTRIMLFFFFIISCERSHLLETTCASRDHARSIFSIANWEKNRHAATKAPVDSVKRENRKKKIKVLMEDHVQKALSTDKYHVNS